MEVFVAILLLFGAFSLGSATSDNSDVDPAGLENPATAYERQDLPGKGVEAGDVEHTQLEDCLADRHLVIYRDLTISYENEIETETEAKTTDTRDSEKAYPDE